MLERQETKASKVFCSIFHLGFKISTFNAWTVKHFMQADFTNTYLLTLNIFEINLASFTTSLIFDDFLVEK